MSRSETRDKILAAAVTTLASEGYSGATARAVARTGGFTPGVIYYHFDGLDDLFVATARYTSHQRLSRYREATQDVRGAVELLERLRELYREDQAGGHVAAMQELFAAATASPLLAEQVRELGQQWQDLVQEVIHARIRGIPLEFMVPVNELAAVVVGAYLGLEMLSHHQSQRPDADALFDAALPVAALLDMTFSSTG